MRTCLLGNGLSCSFSTAPASNLLLLLLVSRRGDDLDHSALFLCLLHPPFTGTTHPRHATDAFTTCFRIYTHYPQRDRKLFYFIVPAASSPSSSAPPTLPASPPSHSAAMASDGGNADTYAYEEEQERKALLQSLHGPMKTWFHGGEASR